MEDDKPVEFPQYQPPGPHTASKKEAGPLIKMMTKMMPKRIKPRLMGKSKGVQSDQNVHVKHKRVKFY